MSLIEDYDVEVKLLAVTGLYKPSSYLPPKLVDLTPETLIEYAGRICWDTAEKIEENPTLIQDWVKLGHESVIEHASATFYIRASRVLTHELVRHRIASYSQRSQRYVKETEEKYIEPPELNKADPDIKTVFKKAMHNAWSAYKDLLDAGIKPEIARYVLPNACETQIIMTMNFRELRHFIKLRTSERALPEMRAVAGKIRNVLKNVAPSVFEDL